MRKHNQELLLRQIWECGEVSRAALARTTGLSRSTVSEIVGGLIESGLVEEAKVARSRGGRPPILLRVRWEAASVVGVELGTHQVRVFVCDLRGETLVRRERAVDAAHDPAAGIDAICALVTEALDDAHFPLDSVVGIGVAVPCPLRPDKPDQLSPRILPAWADVRLGATLHARLGRPIFLENDANLGALAERWFGSAPESDFAFVSLSTGVGAGLFVDGEIYRGATGIAGEIGHTAVDPNGPLCRCGLPGCLEAVIGTPALLEDSGADSIEALVGAALDGDEAARALIARSGRHLGVAIANLVNLLNPKVVVLHGPLTAAGALLLDPLDQMLRARALWTSIVDVEVRVSPLDAGAIARGAAALVLHAALTAPTLFLAAIERPQTSTFLSMEA